jgi:hypothetical protein
MSLWVQRSTRCSTLDEVLVVLALDLRHQPQGLDHAGTEPLGLEPLERPAGAILDNIVQHAHDAPFLYFLYRGTVMRQRTAPVTLPI